MRVSSLVFDYSSVSAKNASGRSEISESLNCDFIFSYSAASVASFLNHNLDLEYIVNTDSPSLFLDKISIYDVSLSNLKLVDWSEKLKDWKTHRYCFYPAMMHSLLHSKEAEKNKESFLKLDNDLICKKSIKNIFQDFDCVIWDYVGRSNNMINSGRDYWGEKYCAMKTVGTTDFMGYNIGVLGYTYDKLKCVKESYDLGILMSEVDISSVTKNHTSISERGKKILAWSEQLASNYVVHSNSLNIKLVSDYFDHHYSNKKNCIDHMQKFRKV